LTEDSGSTPDRATNLKLKIMKHPGHSSAKNEYSGRTDSKLNKNSKEELKDRMKAFAKHLKKLGY